MAGVSIHRLHTLTDMTGQRAAETKTVRFAGIEMGKRVFVLGMAGGALGMLPTFLATMIAGPYGLLTDVAFIGVVVFIGTFRQASGLQLHIYQAAWDRRKARHGQVYVCGAPERDTPIVGLIRQSSTPVSTVAAQAHSPVDEVVSSVLNAPKPPAPGRLTHARRSGLLTPVEQVPPTEAPATDF